MRTPAWAFVIIATGLFVSLASAQTAITLTPDTAVREALAQNRDLRAAQFTIEMARGRLRQAGLWSNPEIEFEGSDDFLFNSEGERGLSTGFEQRFPVAGRLGRAKDVARIDIALAESELRDAQRRLIGEVRQLVYRLMVLQKRIAQQDEVVGKAESLVRVAEERYGAAETSEVDVNLLRVELGRFRAERRLIEIEQKGDAARLYELLGRTPGPIPTLVGDLEAALTLQSRAHAITAALEKRPDLAQHRLQADRGSAEERLARAEKWEDWALGLFYEADRARFDEPGSGAPLGVASPEREQFLGLRVRIPIPLWNRNQGRIAEARASQNRAKARLSGAELAVRREVETAWFEVERFREAVDAYRDELLGLADRNVKLLEGGYADGLVNIAELVQAQQQSASIRNRYNETLGGLWRARIDLETASATSPLLAPSLENAAGKP